MLGDRSTPEDPVHGDSRVSHLLDEIGLTYELDGKGDFVVSFGFENGRTQTAVIESKTHKIGSFEVRHIYSVGYQSTGELPQNIANGLLMMNDKVRLGSWKTIRMQDGTLFAAFQAQVAADTTIESLQTSLVTVCQTADNVEEKLTGEDNY